MVSINECVNDFKKELAKGEIQKAYKGIFDFLTEIKTALLDMNPDNLSSGSMYHGYLDMSYFPIITNVLKKHKLKVAVVFNYESFQLEVWLSGMNRVVSKNIWELLKKKQWNKYPLVKDIQMSDSIMECILRKKIDLERREEIAEIRIMIESFLTDVEEFLKQEDIFL